MTTTEETSRIDDVASAQRIRSSTRTGLIDHPLLAVAMVEGGQIRISNRAWKRLFAMPDDVSVESHVAALFSNAPGADRFEKALQARLVDAEGREPVYAIGEQTLTRRDATTFLAEILVWPQPAFDSHRLLSADALWQVRDVSEERMLRHDLQGLEDYYRELTRHQTDLTFVVDRKGRLSYVSASIEAVLGYRVEALLGESFARLFDAGQRMDAAHWLRAASRVAKSERGEPYRLQVIAQDGSKRLLTCRPRNCFGMPRIAGMVVHAIDITDSIETPVAPSSAGEARLQALRSRLAALARAPIGVPAERKTRLVEETCAVFDARIAVLWECDARGAWSASRIARSTPEHAPAADQVPPLIGAAGDTGLPLVVDDVASDVVVEPMRAALAAAGVCALVEAPVHVDGVLRAFVVVGAAMSRQWDPAEVDFVSAIALMVSAAIAKDARAPAVVDDAIDPLTGLVGRVAVARRLAERVAAAAAASASLVALVVDLDRLHDVNDRFGHPVGDAVIVRAAAVLTAFAGPDDVVARVGADQFLLLLHESVPGALDAGVQGLVQHLADSGFDPVLPRVEASIGLARLAADHSGGDSLWRRAELAAREAKARGRGQAVVFQPGLAAAVAARKVLGDEIEDALAQGQFALFYQPQIALATGRMVGFEAFLRWQHPTRGLVLPDVFIDAATERGLDEAITRTVFAQVCDQVVLWHQVKDFPDLPVSVNVSGRQFNDRRLPAIVASALIRSGLPARTLVLEVIEQNFLFDAVAMERVVGELTRLGVRISIGSFGLGHVSLRSARQLGVAQIKINRGFVEGLPDDAESAVVIKAAIDIAHRLKGQVVAEGVETRAQFECLRALGCEAAQGFYFGAPLSADEILSFVASNREQPVR